MKLIYKERCPICHHALKKDTQYRSLAYMCKSKNCHYSYAEIEYGDPENSNVSFHIPGYSLTYNIADKSYEIFRHDGVISQGYIISIPQIDFEWDNLDKLADRIKTLITFS